MSAEISLRRTHLAYDCVDANVIFITAVCSLNVTQFRKGRGEPINRQGLAYFLCIGFSLRPNGAFSNVNGVGLRGY